MNTASEASLMVLYFTISCTAVHVIFSLSASVYLLFFLYLILSIQFCLGDEARMRQKTRDLHELPFLEMVKSALIETNYGKI